MLRKKKGSEESGMAASGEVPKAPADSAIDPDAPLKSPAARLGDILIEEGIINEDQLNEGLAKQESEGGFLGQRLIELGHLDQDTLTMVLVKQCRIPHLNLLDYQILPDVVKLIPKELCLQHRILPVDKLGKILTVAMVDPLNVDALTAIRERFPDLRIKPILCDWPQFEIVYERSFNTPEPKPGEQPEDDPLLKLISKVKRPTSNKVPTTPPNGGDEAAGSHGDIPVGIVEESPAAISVAGLSAVERKLEMLAHSVAQIAQASDVFQAARRAEEQEVAEGFRKDLESAPAGTRHGVRDLNFGGADASGGTLDAAVKAGLDTGAPLGAYSFDHFIVGKANKVTFEIGKAVAQSPGKDYNPLFVCGDVGLGKTHLINAIGNFITEHSPDTRVGYTSASRFAAHVRTSMDQCMTEAFRSAYSQWDVLILDDIQFLGGHVEAQEEFFHVFNALHQEGRQIVIAGDKTPQKLGLLEQRLVSRFEGGLVAHLAPPEWETRMTILRYHAEKTNTTVPEEVLAMVAMKYAHDVRRLIGCLQKIMAYAQLEKGEVTCELASKILSELGITDAA